MHKEVLYKEQLEILGILKVFSKDFYLAWWTAIALHLWHRKSIDFDLFSDKKINITSILNKLNNNNLSPSRTLISNEDELTVIIKWVKVTFLYYPFNISLKECFEWIKIPDIIILAAMKFYTLWRRWKWKDYVDIYTILNSWYKLSKISSIADDIFSGAYNDKLLREQLCYYEDIDYSEEVDYLWEELDNEKIKIALQKYSIK